METKDILQIAVPIVAGILGYVAGESVGLVKKLFRQRMLKKALLVEIDDARKWIRRNIITLECMIQLSVLGEIANHGPVPVPVQIYDEHFPEINLKLRTGERVSLASIYYDLHRLNEGYSRIHALNPLSPRDKTKALDMQALLDASYRGNVGLLYKIDWHLKHQRRIEEAYRSGQGLGVGDSVRQRSETDRRLLYLASEAKALGSKKVRLKHNDGAARRADVETAGPPAQGKFYVNLAGMKYKCIKVEGNNVTWCLLDSQQHGRVVDIEFVQDIKYSSTYYELRDIEEIARLERRYQSLPKE